MLKLHLSCHRFHLTFLLTSLIFSLTAQTERAFFMKIGNHYILTNEKAELVFPDVFDAIYETTAYDDLDTSLHKRMISYNPLQELIVKRNGKFGVFKGMTYTIPCEYDYLDRLGYVQEVKYYAKKNDRCAFLTAVGKEVTPFVYESIEQVQKNGLFRVKLNGKFKLLYLDSHLTVADYTPAAYDSILIEQGYFILMQSGMKSLCGFLSINEKGHYKCLPSARCDYYVGESDLLQVFPGKNLASSYSFDLTFTEKRTLKPNELKDDYLPFEDELNTDLGEQATYMIMDFLSTIADSTGTAKREPRTYTPEEIRKEIQYRIKNQLEQNRVSYSDLGYTHRHSMKDTISDGKHGCIITTWDTKSKTILKTVIPTVYDEVFFEPGKINHFIRYRSGASYGILNREGRAIFDREWAKVELPDQHMPFIVTYSGSESFVYKYDQLLGFKELIYTGKSGFSYRIEGHHENQLFIYPDNSETSRPIGFLNNFYETTYLGGKRKTEQKAVLLPPVYDSVVRHPTLNNHFLLYQKGKTGLITYTTQTLLPVIYDSLVFNYLFPLRMNKENYDYMSKTSEFFPAICAYKNDSLYYFIRCSETKYCDTDFEFTQTAVLDACVNKISVSLNGLYFKVRLTNGEWQIYSIDGTRLSSANYRFIADYAFNTRTGFWYVPAEDLQHRPVMIGQNGKEFRVPE